MYDITISQQNGKFYVLLGDSKELGVFGYGDTITEALNNFEDLFNQHQDRFHGDE